MPGGPVEHALLPISPAFQCGFQIGRRIAFQAADHADPVTGKQSKPSFPHLQMIVPVEQPALTLDRQIEVFDPLPSRSNVAATAAQRQCKSRSAYPQASFLGLHHWGELSGRRPSMVVAVIDHEPDAQRQLPHTLFGTR